MKEVASQDNASRSTADTNRPESDPSRSGTAATPPDYGIDFLDRPREVNRTGLPDTLKAGVENLSGLSMDDVRVHYNSPKPAQLKALAYAQGTDIHIGPGHERHLPHEAWHVVQQKQGRVAPTMQLKGLLAVNHESHLEREADVMGNAALTQQQSGNSHPIGNANRLQRARSASPAPHSVMQLFQGGRSGHEILIEALQAAGFSEEEAHRVYIGNWLRDFSQLISYDGATLSKIKQFLVPIIGEGEFNEVFNPEDLGVYVPSEHMDNPLGGETIEDPINAVKDYSHLSSRQKKRQQELDSQAAKIQKTALDTGLPDYVVRSKVNAGLTLKEAFEAAKSGNRDKSLRLMGEALHNVEDFFSHTNFVEIATYLVQARATNLDHSEPAESRKLEYEASRRTLQQSLDAKDPNSKKVFDIAIAGGIGPSSIPRLISGSYKPGGNDKVSLLETLKTQLHTKQFINAALLGLARNGARSAGEKGAAIAGTAAKYVDKVSGALPGVGGGLASLAIGDKFSQGYDVASGVLKNSFEKGKHVVGKSVDNVAGRAAAIASVTTISDVITRLRPEASALIDGLVSNLDGILDSQVSKQIKRAEREAPPGTTAHSILAKDSPDHPLFRPAISLAKIAVEGVGRVMHDLLEKPGTLGDAEAYRKIDEVLDKYIAAPDRSSWWKSYLLGEL